MSGRVQRSLPHLFLHLPNWPKRDHGKKQSQSLFMALGGLISNKDLWVWICVYHLIWYMVEGLSLFYSSAMNRDRDFGLSQIGRWDQSTPEKMTPLVQVTDCICRRKSPPVGGDFRRQTKSVTCTSCSSLHSLGSTIDAGYIWVGNLTFKEALLDSLLISIPHLSTCTTIWLISYLINRIPILQIHNKTGYRLPDCIYILFHYRFPCLQWHWLQWRFLKLEMAYLIVKYIWLQWHSISTVKLLPGSEGVSGEICIW